MERKFKYFLEHKQTQMWLCIGDELLTNNPNNETIISSWWDGGLEDWLSPMKEKWYSDFANTVRRRDFGRDFMISIQNMIKEELALKNIDLYTDFIITEHEFVGEQEKLKT